MKILMLIIMLSNFNTLQASCAKVGLYKSNVNSIEQLIKHIEENLPVIKVDDKEPKFDVQDVSPTVIKLNYGF